jgi:hypothetical protein
MLTAFTASATYISLSTAVDMERVINQTSTSINVTITNEGDEPAYDVIVEPTSVGGFTIDQISLGNINPNQTVSGTVNMLIPSDSLPGKYVLGFLIRYNDMNGYPFTFVTPIRFNYKTSLQSNVVGFLNEVDLAGEEKKTLTLRIQNMDEKPHDATVRLYLPNQIVVEGGRERSMTLNPSSETKLDLQISPLGALPGGDYFIFATVDYVDGDKHYSTSTNGRITTSKQRSLMGELAPYVIVVVLVLVIVILYLQLRKDKVVSSAGTAKAGKAKK